MTCYETLSVPPPPACPADAPMAHHLVKWWRNKFRSGYKKFHLVTEGERTDTEELVGRGGAASRCSAVTSAPPDLLPSEARALLHAAPSPSPPPSPAPPPAVPAPPPPTAPPPPPPRHHHREPPPPRLRFEELTCDVSVQEAAAHQPLQFSFTLYDLDGHGRMTKDDIAGIVSTIYESIGKSVTVPHYGSKTIQVRLTVVPEGGAAAPAPAPAAPERPAGARREGRRRARRRKDTKPDCGDGTDDERRSRLSLDEESSCSGERRRGGVRGPRAAAAAAAAAPHAAAPRPRDKERERRPSKKRSGSLQRRELLQIIQANMEKNRLSFQNSRKPHERMIPEEEIPSPKQHRHRPRAFTVSAQPAAATPPRAPRAAPYLDLAPAAASTPVTPATPVTPDTNLCRYDRYLHAVICSSATHAHSGYHRRDLPTTPPIPAAVPAPKPHKTPRAHHRSRSHDVPPPPVSHHPAAVAAPVAAPATPPEPRVLQIIFL